MKTTLAAIAVISVLFTQQQAHAVAQATAQAKMKVVTALSVTRVSDLIFSEAFAGTAEETVGANVLEDDHNASFLISGEPNRAIAVDLPYNNTVVMTTGAGGPDGSIAVNSFTSNFATSNIGPSGNIELFVGATRAALSPTQVSGDYSADFTVNVAYQ